MGEPRVKIYMHHDESGTSDIAEIRDEYVLDCFNGIMNTMKNNDVDASVIRKVAREVRIIIDYLCEYVEED